MVSQSSSATTTSSGSTKPEPSAPPRNGSQSQFPGKLHSLMLFVDTNNLESIISWELNGYGIKINNPDKLVSILPLFFSQTKYRSFRRQLNMWHFHRILNGPHKDVWIHKYFVKHTPELCAKMSRNLTDMMMSESQREALLVRSSSSSSPSFSSSQPPKNNESSKMNVPHEIEQAMSQWQQEVQQVERQQEVQQVERKQQTTVSTCQQRQQPKVQILTKPRLPQKHQLPQQWLSFQQKYMNTIKNKSLSSVWTENVSCVVEPRVAQGQITPPPNAVVLPSLLTPSSSSGCLAPPPPPPPAVVSPIQQPKKAIIEPMVAASSSFEGTTAKELTATPSSILEHDSFDLLDNKIFDMENDDLQLLLPFVDGSSTSTDSHMDPELEHSLSFFGL